MKVLMINGSPRAEGNTTLALREMETVFREAGVDVISMQVGNKAIRGCIACGKCVKACPQNLIEIVPYESKYRVQCHNQQKGKAVKVCCEAGCIGCGLCERNCPNDAIKVTDNIAKIDYDKCVECGLCAQKCPSKVIRIYG